MPTATELLANTDFEARGHFIETRFPYTYGYDFVRATPSIFPEEVQEALPNVNFYYMSRADAAGCIKEWAAYESWDKEELIFRLAVAYCMYYRIDVPTSFYLRYLNPQENHGQ